MFCPLVLFRSFDTVYHICPTILSRVQIILGGEIDPVMTERAEFIESSDSKACKSGLIRIE